jgi:hypothetical protein
MKGGLKAVLFFVTFLLTSLVPRIIIYMLIKNDGLFWRWSANLFLGRLFIINSGSYLRDSKATILWYFRTTFYQSFYVERIDRCYVLTRRI